MRQRATVEAVSGKIAVVSVLRESACSGECHKCAGCGAVKQTLHIRAENPIGAGVGDKVYVDSSTGVVLWAAVLVYLVPIFGFFAGYFLGSRWQCPGIFTVVGFLLGWGPALLYNAYVKKCPPKYTLTAFAEQQWQ